MSAPPVEPDAPAPRWQPIAVALVAVALTLGLFLPGHTLLDGYDWARMHACFKSYYRDALLDGRLPLWNPQVGLGRPFLADTETATLYPANLVFLAGLGTGVLASLGLHFALVISGGLRLARRLGATTEGAWLGALAFAYGAPLIGRLQSGQFQVFCTLCWLPLALDFGCEVAVRPTPRAAVRFALALALMFLAGSPPMFWICFWAIALFTAIRAASGRNLLWLTGCGVLATGLVAVQALPFLELVTEGNRPLEAPAFALAHPQTGKSWLSLFVSKPATAYFNWEYNLFAGLPLAIAAAGSLLLWRSREVRALYVLALVFALLALSAATPLLPWLVAHVPGWSALRMPSRYAIVTAFAVAMLGALAASRLLRWAHDRWPRLSRHAHRALLAAAALNAADCLRALHERSAKYAGPALNLQESRVQSALQARGLLQDGAPPPRVLGHYGILRENSGLARGYSTMASYANPALARVWDYMHVIASVRPNPMDPTNVPVEIFSLPGDRFKGASFAAWWDPAQRDLVFSEKPEPRAFFIPAVEVVRDWREANRRIAAEPVLPRTALVEMAWADALAGLPGRADAPPIAAEIRSFQPEHIVTRIRTAAAGVMIWSESWFPGWTATVDGQPAPVVPVNGWMRGVRISAGEHEIEMRYRPPSLVLGALITLLATGIAVALWIRHPARGQFGSLNVP